LEAFDRSIGRLFWFLHRKGQGGSDHLETGAR
jgi:hypothetical protein